VQIQNKSNYDFHELEVERETSKSNKNVFKHFMDQQAPSSTPRIPSCMKMSSYKTWSKSKSGLKLFNGETSLVSKSLIDLSNIDCDEVEKKQNVKKSVYKNIRQCDIWENADRQIKDCYDKNGDKNVTKDRNPKNTLNKAPLTEFFREKTKTRRNFKEQSKMYSEDKTIESEALEIYQEILDIVNANSPASLPVSREKKVGYGELPVGILPVGILKQKHVEQPGHERISSKKPARRYYTLYCKHLPLILKLILREREWRSEEGDHFRRRKDTYHSTLQHDSNSGLYSGYHSLSKIVSRFNFQVSDPKC
jgi:hypothetical protein